MTGLGDIASANYVLLTTYRKDGSPVGTPVWAVASDDKLFIWTDTNSWKVKRIGNNPDVTVQTCDVRGGTKPGSPVVAGTARLLDAAETDRVRGLLRRKYWIIGPPFILMSTLFRGKKGTIGIEVTPT